MEQTNVTRLLNAAGVAFTAHSYEAAAALSGVEAAARLGKHPDQVFKTLVTVAASGGHYVFLVPSACALDLKKAAACVGEKHIEMIKTKALLPLTGYVHGGCSPIGMKKKFTTVMDETAVLWDTILVSAGKIGRQIELSPTALQAFLPCDLADVTGSPRV